jgi:hypothetical protein
VPQDDLKKALMASIQDLDPANPWVKDPSGKHTNVSLLLDWPEEDDDDDDDDGGFKPRTLLQPRRLSHRQGKDAPAASVEIRGCPVVSDLTTISSPQNTHQLTHRTLS